MATDGHADRRGPSDWDEALERLEDFIFAYPRDRALPDLATIVDRAELPDGFLREDERAHKVLLEAIADRPLASMELVGQVRTEVELLTLEVEILGERLRATTEQEEQRATAERLAAVRRRLEDIRRHL
ncbi:MAG TPA: hypothetical protein VHF25_15310 [Nitriliruptorales bacterium]|nr:hypothetical protein [Nitriliruptorales bacterium]